MNRASRDTARVGRGAFDGCVCPPSLGRGMVSQAAAPNPAMRYTLLVRLDARVLLDDDAWSTTGALQLGASSTFYHLWLCVGHAFSGPATMPRTALRCSFTSRTRHPERARDGFEVAAPPPGLVRSRRRGPPQRFTTHLPDRPESAATRGCFRQCRQAQQRHGARIFGEQLAVQRSRPPRRAAHPSALHVLALRSSTFGCSPFTQSGMLRAQAIGPSPRLRHLTVVHDQHDPGRKLEPGELCTQAQLAMHATHVAARSTFGALAQVVSSERGRVPLAKCIHGVTQQALAVAAQRVGKARRAVLEQVRLELAKSAGRNNMARAKPPASPIVSARSRLSQASVESAKVAYGLGSIGYEIRALARRAASAKPWRGACRVVARTRRHALIAAQRIRSLRHATGERTQRLGVRRGSVCLAPRAR